MCITSWSVRTRAETWPGCADCRFVGSSALCALAPADEDAYLAWPRASAAVQVELRTEIRNKRAVGSVQSHMTSSQMDETTLKKPLRLWPGVVAVALQWLFWFGVPLVVPGAVLRGDWRSRRRLVVLVWWLFFSRAPWSERVGAIVLMVVALVATTRIVHESIANGMMGMMFPIYAIPVLSLALVAWAVASRRLSRGPRRASMVGSHPAGVRSVHAPADRRHHRRCRFGSPLAMDARLPRNGFWPRPATSRQLPRRFPQSSDPRDASRPSRDEPKPHAPPATARLQEAGPAHAATSRRHSLPIGSRKRGRMARLSWTEARRHHPRRADRDRLVSVSRRSNCGAGRSDRAGRPSRSAAISSTPRSSAATTRSSPATT